MTLQVALHHETRYRYDQLVRLGPHVIRLRPAPHTRTPILSYSLRIEPEPHFLNWQQDPHGNFLARLVVPDPARELLVSVDLVAEMAVINPFDFFLEPAAETWPFAYERDLADELAPFLEVEPAGPRLRAWLAPVARTPTPTIDFLVEQNRRLRDAIAYVIRLEPGIQGTDETLELGSGSCRDSAWLLVQILRQLGVAARFASGYLIQLVPDHPSLDGPSGPERDFTDLHAWAEAYLPGAGWVGLDPTSGLLAGEGHIPLACSPKPQSAAPITGTLDPCEVGFEHAMSVTRVRESPRVTKPYTEEQWRAILELGRAVDRRLEASDVRLTMGGEPTFVSIDDPDSAEWNTEALGPTKRILADDLVRRLRARFAPEGVLHYGQGKWYPGEPLPRWSFSLFWREDGRPLWRKPALVAAENEDHAPEIGAARRFAEGVARRLGLDPAHALPAFEDPLHFTAREALLPENVDPLEARLDDAQERARLARVLGRGLGAPVAVVLPAQLSQARDGRRWRSERWSLRRDHLYLVPGDSPAGFRLPLGALPWIAPLDYPHVVEADPFEARRPFAATPAQRQPWLTRGEPPAEPRAPARDDAPGAVVRTALVFEPRSGRLCIFLPPLAGADDYVDLVAAIEDTAAELATPIHIEGYPPPRDPRLRALHVTPDPGVIEVNVQPASRWDELVEITTAVYEEARLARLETEKFMLDGRHTGTGGGNHFVLGGPSPTDSPFLRRPDLLRSLLACWQNHPGLSYLFSGLFIGPTSQAPRVDEARHDSLYELEIAFGRVPGPPEQDLPPWLVDRLFRDLLVDVSGNTHRAEFCIDKLYSPDGPSGRQGLLELRAFEMPPHPRMSLVQQLLLRSLVAWLWEHPHPARLVRWGTQLHDRFMLPHFVWADFQEVLTLLREAGFPLRDEWFGPHFEFRFPRHGSVEYAGILLELRQALEPWHVLGEDAAIGGTARYVDSSVERLQVRVQGLGEGRHVVACNGRRVPLHPTGRRGELVAGVRYRAWQPSRCLHPTIPVHAPLTFDLVDTWSGRAVAGCTYHVAHPGGRSFERFPVNAYEAESRRSARFLPFGHTPGPCLPPQEAPDPEFPSTLDLRRPPREGGPSPELSR
jgi:uncharacterized protein (DUF2126 family)